MIIYKVCRTETTANYTECIFLETLTGIYAEQPGNGFFKHPTFTTPKDLENHLKQLKNEGFKIKKSIITCKA